MDVHDLAVQSEPPTGDQREVEQVIEKALSITDRSVVIDFRVDQREMCFPMVPAGKSIGEMMLAMPT